MRLEAIARPSPTRRFGLPLLALVLTFVVGGLLALAAGANPLATFGLILKGAVGSKFALLETLNRATPLIFTGLAVAVAFRAKLWNIGAEAQLYAGALATVIVGTGLGLPGWMLIPLMALAAVVSGALVLLGPVLLKTRLGVDEVVTTLLFNFIMILFVSMLLEGVLKDPMGMGWPKSAPIPKDARLPRLVEGLRLHWGFGLALIAALAGFSEVAGLRGNLTLDVSPGFGYTGIIVAMLALLHPLGVVGTALFVAGIFVGADSMSRVAEVPTYIADILVAVALLFMVLALAMTRFRMVRG